MKYLLILLLSALVMACHSGKEKAEKPADQKDSSGVSKKVVYRDASGNILPDTIAIEMLMSEDYHDRLDYDNLTITLYPLTDSEKLKRDEVKPRPSSSFKSGFLFPALSMKDLEGNPVRIRDLRGKILVINYWFINCPPCRREMPALNKLVDDFRSDSSVVFLGIATDAAPALRDFLLKSSFKYRIIPEGNAIAGQPRIEEYPTHVVVDRKGKIVFHCGEGGPRAVWWVRKSILTVKN